MSIFGQTPLNRRQFTSIAREMKKLHHGVDDDGALTVDFAARYTAKNAIHSVGGELIIEETEEGRIARCFFTYWGKDLGEPPHPYNSMARLNRIVKPLKSEWFFVGRGLFSYPAESWTSRTGLPKPASADQERLGYDTITGISFSSERDDGRPHSITVDVNSHARSIDHDVTGSSKGANTTRVVRHVHESIIQDSARFIEQKKAL